MKLPYTTYELIFPCKLRLDAAANLFTTLSGLFGPVRGVIRPGPTIVFEILGTSGSLRYRLSFPQHLAEVVRGHLRGSIPNIGIRQADSQSPVWSAAVEIHRPSGSWTEAEPQFVPTLLNSLRGLRADESVLVSLAMTPAGALGKIMASGSEPRAREIINQVLIAYRSLGVAACRQIGKHSLARLSHQTASVGLRPMSLTATSLAVVCGLPIDSPEVPGLTLGIGKRLPAESSVPSVGRRIMWSNFLGGERALAMSPTDRLRHLYLVGPTGVGKSTTMENLIVDDIEEGYGVALIDPKGDSVERVLNRLPHHRLGDVVLFDMADTKHPVGFNILAGSNPYAVAGQLVTVFDKLYGLSGAPRAMNILRPTVLTLAMQGYTLCELPIILEAGSRGEAFRHKVVAEITNPEISRFWGRFEALSDRDKNEHTAPIMHRLSALLLYPELNATLGQATSGFEMGQILAENKILLVPLNRGKLGEDLSSLVGSLVMAKLWQAVQVRQAGQAREFYCYVDEFQDVLNLPVSFTEMFSQARGYRFGLTIAHQHTGQLSTEIRREVFANVRSKLVFQTAAEDARILSRELGQLVDESDVMNLGQYEVIARLVAEGRVTQPATGRTFPPSETTGMGRAARAKSHARYGRPANEAQAELAARHGGSDGGPRGKRRPPVG
ncbi:TraM recognition domain-containing protein [Streptomyces olivoreticuli]